MGIEGGDNIFKRIVLTQNPAENRFGNYFGVSEIELIEALDVEGLKIGGSSVLNPFRFGFYSVDNRDIIGNYIELGYDCNYRGNEEAIVLKDPDGVEITCIASEHRKKPNFVDDLRILLKLKKNRMIKELLQITKENSLVEQLKILSKKFKDQIVFSTSFQFEDQVITDLITFSFITFLSLSPSRMKSLNIALSPTRGGLAPLAVVTS